MRALEIGPGTHPVDKSWDTLDMVGHPTIKHDIRTLPLPVADSVYDLVYMSHILEHVPWFQTIDVLKEVRRLLRHGGSVEIWVPDFSKIITAYAAEKCGDMWYRNNPERDFMMWVNGRIFTYGPGEENWHRAVFDEGYLKRCIKKAGFAHVAKLSKPRGYDHGAINLGIAGFK